MKVKFTKLAALLLAGAALLASGCTDYEVDIQNVDKKVDALATKTTADLASQKAALEQAISALETSLKQDIADLKKADENTAKAIEDLQNKYQNLLDNKADKSELQKAKTDLEAAIAAEEARAKEAEEAAAAAIKKINEETIPAINQQIKDLQDLKLDASTFEQYKSATAETLRLLQDAVTEIQATYATKEELNQAVAGIEEKLNDYVLKTTFDEFVKIAATKAELQQLEAAMNGKLEELKKYVDDQDAAVKTYVNGEIAKLQGQLDKITNEEGTGRLDVLEKVAKEYTQKVDDIVALLEFAEGDLQGYIDDADAATLEAAIAYTDEQIAAAKNEILGYIVDLYNMMFAALERIQSVVFVPTHDDLKMNMNVSIMTQDVTGEDGKVEKVAYYMGQPTEVTYKVTPTEYAEWLAYYVQNFLLDKEWSQLFKEYLDYSIPAVYFDVKPLQTRADEEEEELTPELGILGVVNSDNVSGEITFLVDPINIASPEFIANALQPVYTKELYTSDGEFVLAGSFDEGYEDEGYVDGTGLMGMLDYIFGVNGYAIPVWKFEDRVNYEFRQPFAASLTVYVPDADNYYLTQSEGDLSMEDYVLFSNEVASPYSVLYPITSTVDILPDPYKPELDEDGNEVLDEDGYHVLVAAVPEYQYLPYSSLRENPVGESKDQDPKGYRVVLDQAQPAVSIDGGEPMLLTEASSKYMIYYPYVFVEPVKFTYDKGTQADPENFIVTDVQGPVVEGVQFEGSDHVFDGIYVVPQTIEKYAEVEMNPAKTAAERKAAIGNIITGTYTFTSFLGSFSAYGDVEITPALGDVKVDAEIVWTYENDALVDHNIFYEEGEPTVYSRAAYEINVDEEDAQYLADNLAIDLTSFAGQEPVEYTITYAQAADPEVEGSTATEVDAKDKVVIENVAIKDGKLLADISFPADMWDKVFTITAKYELEDATITVHGTLTTIDRNREKVVLGPYEHTFVVNGPEYVDGYYKWSSDPLHADIFTAFNNEGVVNVQGITIKNGDFEYDAEQKEFNAAELEGKIRMANPSGTAQGYVDVNRNDIVLNTMSTLTPAVLAGELFNSGKRSETDPNLWLGNPVTRNITTYIGEEVEITMIFNYKVPDYNFLHLSVYTFNTDASKAYAGTTMVPFIQSYPLPAEIEGVPTPYEAPVWWTQVNPSYFTEVKTENTTEDEAQNLVSFRHALADYDVKYINLAELAFNVVDEKDNVIEPEDLEELGLAPKFIYTDETLGEKEIPAADKAACNNEFLLYSSLWVDNTTFYYLTNEHPFIPALGTLTLTVGEGDAAYDFPVATRFEFPKNSVKYAEVELDYSKYAMVRWTPFKAPQANGFTMVLDENKIYSEPLFKGMYLQDNRPNNVSYYVIKDGEWVIGNVTEFDAEAGTYTKGGNGYVSGINAKDAYHIKASFDYSKVELPAELQRLLTIKYSADGETFVDAQDEAESLTPYVVFDYRSEVQFRGTIDIPVVVRLDNPWQQPIVFSYKFTIKGTQE